MSAESLAYGIAGRRGRTEGPTLLHAGPLHEATVDAPATAIPGAPPCLQAIGLECVRGRRLLFSDLDLTLHSGGLVQVQGANGSGKTTLLRVLCGLASPTGGEVRWGGEPIEHCGADYRAVVAYVGHLQGIKGELTPLENLEVASALSGAPPALAAEDVLARVGLAGHADAPCSALSAGQRQRAALARLLAARRPLWVLDEPFSALDRDGHALLEDLLAEHTGHGGLVVLSTHRSLGLDGPNVTELRLPT